MRLRPGRAILATVTITTASSLLTSPSALAAGELTNATAVSSTVLDLPLAVGQANCPGLPTSPQSLLPLTIGDITIGLVSATCNDTSASASVASVRIVDASDPNNTVVLDAIQSSCDRETGRATSAVTLKLGNLGVSPGSITESVSVPLGGLGLFLNEPFEAGGFKGVNAVRVQVGGPEQGQNVILAQSRCATSSMTASASVSTGGNLLGDLLRGLLGIG